MSINHDEAKRICEGLGTSYQWPGDDAVKLVFKAYIELARVHRQKSSIGTETIAALMEARQERDALTGRVETLTKERDAAKADAARREALEKYADEFMVHGERGHPSPELQRQGSSALAATDSGAWLEKRDRELIERLRNNELPLDELIRGAK